MAVDWRRLATATVQAAVRAGVRSVRRSAPPSPGPGADAARRPTPRSATPYPGDFTGTARVEYAPRADGQPDPGEVVWTWVPFEEDHTRGKDRPVLVVGREGSWLLALMLTSKDHEGPGSDERDERRHGRDWTDLGAGPWDRQGRPSQVRTDRVVRVDPVAVRREGAQLDAARFEQVAGVLRAQRGWA